jgi:hypothetical protein
MRAIPGPEFWIMKCREMINDFPYNNYNGHTFDSSCKCKPKVLITDEGDLVVVHNVIPNTEPKEMVLMFVYLN